MTLFLTKVGVVIDKLALKIYKKKQNKILRKYLEKRIKIHIKKIVEGVKDILENGSQEQKKEIIKKLTEMGLINE